MSRFSKIPVKISEGTKVEVQPGKVKVTGPKGTLERIVPDVVDIKIEGDVLSVSSKDTSKFADAVKGTIRSHIVNMIAGVGVGWNKKMELQGTGYRAEVRGDELVLTV